MASPGAPSPVTFSLLAVLLAATLQGPAAADSSSGLQPDTPADKVPLQGLHRDVIPVNWTRGRVCCDMIMESPRQKALAKAAIKFLGRSRIVVNGRRFKFDCSGLARAVYFSQGFDLYFGLGEMKHANGVWRIYGHVVRYGRIHYGPTVRPGDLVFFHNTWDFDGDGRLNDPLTHVGVVEQVKSDGTVVFVSWIAEGGIRRFRMNLRMPDAHRAGDGRVLNDFVRKKGFRDPKATRYLTGQLFAAFGTLLQ